MDKQTLTGKVTSQRRFTVTGYSKPVTQTWSATYDRYTRSPVVKTSFASFRPPTPFRATRIDVGGKDSVLIGDNDLIGPPNRVTREAWSGSTTDTNWISWLRPYVSASGVIVPSPSARSYTQVTALRNLAQAKLELGVALAESRSSIRMIAIRSAQMAQLALAMRRGSWTQVRRLLGLRGKHIASSKRFADNYLEYIFGWAPLASDVMKASKTFVEGLQRPQVMRGFSSFSEALPYVPDSPQRRSPYTSYRKGSLKRVTRTTLWASPNSSYISALSTLGLINPLSVAWAVVPFSFVVDWLLPIGDFLDATTASCGLDFLGGSSSTQILADGVTVDMSAANNYARVHGGLETPFRVAMYDRVVLGDFPGPMPYYIKNPFSMGKAVTSTALIAQLRR